MALIKCPECGKEISDKSKQCIHCGYPLDYQDIINNNNGYNVVFKGFRTNKLQNQYNARVVAQIRQIMDYDLSTAYSCIKTTPGIICESTSKKNAEWLKNVFEPYGCIIEITDSGKPVTENEKLNIMASEGKTIICPHCGSSNISTGARGFSALTGFIGSGKTVNRCANCGWKWEP